MRKESATSAWTRNCNKSERLHDQDMAQARYQIDYLEAEIENLRRDRAALSENLHEDLEEER